MQIEIPDEIAYALDDAHDAYAAALTNQPRRELATHVNYVRGVRAIAEAEHRLAQAYGQAQQAFTPPPLGKAFRAARDWFSQRARSTEVLAARVEQQHRNHR